MEYYFETTPYMAQLGKQLLVASDSTCTEYHKAKVKQKIGKDQIKIEFTHKKVPFLETISIKDKRIWRGTLKKESFFYYEEGQAYYPKFESVAVDLNKARNFALPADKGGSGSKSQTKKEQASKSDKEIRAEKKSNVEESPKTVKGKKAEDKKPQEDGKRKRDSVSQGGVAPATEIKSKEALGTSAQNIAEGSKPQKTRSGVSPLTENGAAAVLKKLASTSPMPPIAKPSEAGLPRKSWKSLELSAAARNLAPGDSVEAWVEATGSRPGGWIRCTLMEMTVLESGACSPYYAFLHLKFDLISFSDENKEKRVYHEEWRPLASTTASGDAPRYIVHVRVSDSAKRRSSELQPGDRVEVLESNVWCPGTLKGSSYETMTGVVILDHPSLDKKTAITNVPFSRVRKAHPYETEWHGMLREVKP